MRSMWRTAVAVLGVAALVIAVFATAGGAGARPTAGAEASPAFRGRRR